MLTCAASHKFIAYFVLRAQNTEHVHLTLHVLYATAANVDLRRFYSMYDNVFIIYTVFSAMLETRGFNYGEEGLLIFICHYF